MSDEQIQSWRAEMKLIVEHRNTLIHQLAGKLDTNSIASCEALSAELDAQRDRFLEPMRILSELIREHGEVMRESALAFVESAPHPSAGR